MPPPGNKGVLGSWGQSQLRQRVLLAVLMAPSISAHLGGAACFFLAQASSQTGHGAQGHADLALRASVPCYHACACCASLLCSCWVTSGAAGSNHRAGLRCSPSRHLCAEDMPVRARMAPGRRVSSAALGKKKKNPPNQQSEDLF